MAVSRTMWLRGIQIDAAKMKDNARYEREQSIKEITRKWKEGFAALKAENDQMQKDVAARYVAEIAEIDAMTKQQIAQGPPAG